MTHDYSQHLPLHQAAYNSVALSSSRVVPKEAEEVSIQEGSNQRLDKYWNMQNRDLPMHAVLLEDNDKDGTHEQIRTKEHSPSPVSHQSLSESSSGRIRRCNSISEALQQRLHPSSGSMSSPESDCMEPKNHSNDPLSNSATILSKGYQERFDQVRAEMLQLLETRLQARCGVGSSSSNPSNAVDNDDDADMMNDDFNPQQGSDIEQSKKTSSATTSNDKIVQTAKALEQLLYQQSQHNLKIYQDMSTLDARLRDLMTILVRRRMMNRAGGQRRLRRRRQISSSANAVSVQDMAMGQLADHKQQSYQQQSFVSRPPDDLVYQQLHQQQRSNSTNTKRQPLLSARRRFLLQLLGKSRYQEIQDLVQEIRMTKMKKVATFCGSSSCTTATTTTTTTPMRLWGKMFDTQLPKVVRELYFETRLVECWQQYPIERLSKVPWDSLIEQAQSNLLAYQLWEMQLGKEQYK